MIFNVARFQIKLAHKGKICLQKLQISAQPILTNLFFHYYLLTSKRTSKQEYIKHVFASCS